MAWVNTNNAPLTSDIEQVSKRKGSMWRCLSFAAPPRAFSRRFPLPPQLFSGEPAPEPAQPAAAPPPAGSGPSGFGGGGEALNTLDESVWETVKRDLVRIAKNLWMVVFPFNDRSSQNVALRNWDLWGPMVRACRA